VNLTTEAIWSDLDAWKDAARQLHHEPYELYRDFYIGGDRPLAHIRKNSRESDEHWLERIGRLVGANYCAPIVNKPVQAEYGRGVQRLVADAELQARLDTIARANAIHTFQTRTARQRAIDGAAIVQLYWDAAAGGVRLKHILPEHFFPVVTDDWGRLDAVIIDRSGTQAAQSWEGSSSARVEIYTPDDIAIYEDGVRVNDPAGLRPWERPAQYGVLPFVVFNGRRLVGDVLGTSMLRGIAELNHALNESLNNVLEILRFQAFSLLVIQGGLHGLPLDADGRPKLAIGEAGFLNIDSDGRVYFADPNPKIGEVLAVIERLVRMMYETGSIPVSVVQPQQSHAESAASRQIQFMPLVDLVEELVTFDTESERELVEKALLLDQVHGAGPTTIEAVRERAGAIEIAYPRHILPVDEAARFELLRAKHEAGVLTFHELLRAEHPDLSEEELAARTTKTTPAPSSST